MSNIDGWMKFMYPPSRAPEMPQQNAESRSAFMRDAAVLKPISEAARRSSRDALSSRPRRLSMRLNIKIVRMVKKVTAIPRVV